MNRFVRVIGLGISAVVLAACSETAFMDTLGIGKSVPNEKLVATNPPLSVPPDLRLPPPGQAAPRADASAAASAGQAQTLAAPPADATAAAYGAAAAGTTQGAAASRSAKTAAVAPTRKNDVYDDIFARYGISRYHPDGREKTIAELNRELAEKIKEEKRRQNPNYGTILNIGSLFK